MKQENSTLMKWFIKILQGILIGLGAVLPGISGGVLCVMFDIYHPIMELMADPFHRAKTHIPKLFPVLLGGIIGFLGIANILSAILEKYPTQSICMFIGLIGGMLPSLLVEAGKQEETIGSYSSMVVAMVITFILFISLKLFSVKIVLGFMCYLFCGCCLALSVIVPGMSFSTLLMPLGLYEPFITGIGHMDIQIIIPGGIGTLMTIFVLSKGVNRLFDTHYSIAMHGIIGIVIAATITIIPFASIVKSLDDLMIHTLCISLGVGASYGLSRLNAD